MQGTLASQARRDKQPRQEEHQRHDVDVLPGAKEIEAVEASVVDYGKGEPEKRRLVESRRRRRRRADVGETGVERNEDQNEGAAQIDDRATCVGVGARVSLPLR